MIRTAVNADLPRLKELMQLLHDKSPYGHIEIEWPLVDQMMMQAMNHAAVFVHERRGKIGGFIICGLKPLWWNPRFKIGTDVFFMPGNREAGAELLGSLCGWCYRHKVMRIECGISSFTRLEDIQSIYLSAGFKREGSLFVHSFMRDSVCPVSSTM